MIDVLCVGMAAYDLIFSIDFHPAADEKVKAFALDRNGGGPAANAAVAVSRLGYSAAFAGYLGHDPFGEAHLAELTDLGVITDLISRGTAQTSLSAILVKPDGRRTVVNFHEHESRLVQDYQDLLRIKPRVILFDGHEPLVSLPLARVARQKGIPTILDAGSVHQGTVELSPLVDYLVCSEKFAHDFTGELDESLALTALTSYSPNVIVTLGERGLIWQNPTGRGCLPAFEVKTVDSTGAGDTFHGALAACIAIDLPWLESLEIASAAAAISCTKMGARPGIPTMVEVCSFLALNQRK